MSATGLPIPDSQDASPSEMGYRLGRGFAHVCTNCLVTGCELSKCSKCKAVVYCSKKCQMAHWPKHKAVCSKVDGSGMHDFVQNAFSNSFFNLILQACFILQFDLLRAPQLDKPFVVLVDLAIEPVELRDFCRIFTGQPLGEEKIMGMVQLNSFLPYSPAQALALNPGKKTVWRRFKDALGPKDTGSSVGIAEIANGENRVQMTCPILIMEEVLDMVRASRPWKLECHTGGFMEMPLTIAGSMEYLNSCIRGDRNNEMGLRTEMRPSDIKTIRDAGSGSDSFTAKILRDKMEREAGLKPLLDMMRKRWATA
ncbi:hypothetical protein FB451DRAFT_1285757 [Mycena latifolia]|nr:hypothetical protein FB451DRAFT_1285757 [Mycena latifolia]